MGDISAKLSYLNETKNLIKQAIISKGVNISDTDTFRSYAGKIAEISTGSSVVNYTFTINPTPSTAVVTLTADGYTQDGNSITVASGTDVSYSVSATGYTAQSDTVTVLADTSLDITLSSENSSGPGREPDTDTDDFDF